MKFLSFLFLLLGAFCQVRSAEASSLIEGAEEETIQYHGGDIQFPMRVSIAREQHYSRIVTFADCMKIDITQDWSPADLFAEKRGNTLTLQLRSPTFSTPVQVFGDDGQVYVLNVFPSDREGDLSTKVKVFGSPRDAADARKGAAASLPESIDSQLNRLTKHLYGYKLQPDASYAPDYDKAELEKGNKVVGRIIKESDSFSIKSIRIYRLKDVVAYMCPVVARGDNEKVYFNFQTIYIPNQRSILPRTIDIVDPKNPGITLIKGKPRILYFFALAKD